MRAKEISVMPDRNVSYNILKMELAEFEKWVITKYRHENEFYLINY